MLSTITRPFSEITNWVKDPENGPFLGKCLFCTGIIAAIGLAYKAVYSDSNTETIASHELKKKPLFSSGSGMDLAHLGNVGSPISPLVRNHESASPFSAVSSHHDIPIIEGETQVVTAGQTTTEASALVSPQTSIVSTPPNRASVPTLHPSQGTNVGATAKPLRNIFANPLSTTSSDNDIPTHMESAQTKKSEIDLKQFVQQTLEGESTAVSEEHNDEEQKKNTTSPVIGLEVVTSGEMTPVKNAPLVTSHTSSSSTPTNHVTAATLPPAQEAAAAEFSEKAVTPRSLTPTNLGTTTTQPYDSKSANIANDSKSSSIEPTAESKPSAHVE